MAFEFKLPDIGEGIHEGEIVKWFFNEGDEVKEDDVLCEVQNDKAVVEIPSPVDGTVLEIKVAEGEVAIVGDVLIRIDAEGYESEEPAKEIKEEAPTEEKETETAEEKSTPKETTKPVTEEEKKLVIAMPSVRKYAREQGVNIQEVISSLLQSPVLRSEEHTSELQSRGQLVCR